MLGVRAAGCGPCPEQSPENPGQGEQPQGGQRPGIGEPGIGIEEKLARPVQIIPKIIEAEPGLPVFPQLPHPFGMGKHLVLQGVGQQQQRRQHCVPRHNHAFFPPPAERNDPGHRRDVNGRFVAGLRQQHRTQHQG